MKRARRRPAARDDRPLSLLRDPDTQPIRRYPESYPYHPAPVAAAPPPRRFAGQDWQMDLTDAPGPIPIDERCQDALDCLRLKFKHLWREGMLFRIDEAERVRLRGEKLPEGERIITEYRKESAAHLMGPRQPWDAA